MKNFLLVLAALVTLSFSIFAQRITKANYYFAGHIDSTMGTGHGIAVDPEGKIWYASYSDTNGVRVLGKDLKPASISGIKSVTYNGTTVNTKVSRGMTTDQNGNIILTVGSTLLRLDYKTGQCLNYATYKEFSGLDNAGSLTQAGVDGSGNVYVAKVGPGGAANPNPIWILNPDFTKKGTVVDTQIVWTRSVAVSKDGKDVYVGSTGAVPEHYKLGEDGKYTKPEDDQPEPIGMWEGEPPIGQWGGEVVPAAIGKTGNVWFCDGASQTVFIYNPATKQFSQIRGLDVTADMSTPRALALSATEDTVFVCNFNGGFTSVFIKGGGFNGTELFDDFADNNTTTAWGGEWTKFAASGTINLAIADGAMHVTGTWNSYGGVQAAMVADTNITRFDGITFKAKAGGNTNEAWVRVREAKAESDRGYAYMTYKFTPTADWTTYFVPWDQLTVQYGDLIPGFDATDIRAIDFAASKAAVEADFFIDDVAFYGNAKHVYVNNTTGVEDLKGNAVPQAYSLSQNYPNPFNPSTKIQFSMMQNGNVTLKVYDVVGREVASLINNQFMSAGQHQMQFNANNLTSGVYFYRLNVNGNVLTNKMMLMK